MRGSPPIIRKSGLLSILERNAVHVERVFGLLLLALGVFVAAAILTPPDPISQLAMAIPTLGLYEIAILAVAYVEKRAPPADES